MNGERIELVCAADARFLPHIATMLLSAIDKSSSLMRVHFLHHDVMTEAVVEPLRNLLARSGAELCSYGISDDFVRREIGESRPYSYWYRLLFAQLAPSLDKALYLDADIIVTDDLTPLWQQDISGYLWGAVCNPLYPSMEPWPLTELGMPSLARYVNSGVLLMNLQRMRREAVTARFRDYVSAHAHIHCPDQDTINALYHDRCLLLHPRWNLQTTFYELPTASIPVDAIQIREALARPAVVHFISISKPWHYLSKHPLRALYAHYRAQTPWPNYDLEDRNWLNSLLRPLPAVWQYRAFDWIAAVRTLKARLSWLLKNLPPTAR